jgi:hypothetical protein
MECWSHSTEDIERNCSAKVFLNPDAHTVQDLAIERKILVPLSFHQAGESPKGSRV